MTKVTFRHFAKPSDGGIPKDVHYEAELEFIPQVGTKILVSEGMEYIKVVDVYHDLPRKSTDVFLDEDVDEGSLLPLETLLSLGWEKG